MKTLEIQCQGYSVAADLYEGTSSKILLVLVGFSSNKANYKDLTSAIVSKSGYSALVLDYSGHGESPFELAELTPAQNFLEVITAFDWITNNDEHDEISVMGASYGGYLATQLTKYRQFENLVLRAPAIYPPNVFYTKWKDINDDERGTEYRSRVTEIMNHPLLGRASNFTGNTFVVQHELDDVCPKESTDVFIEKFNADKWVAEGFQHSIKQSDISREQIEEYQTKIAFWLKSNS